MSLGASLRSLRTGRGLTLGQAGAKAGVSHATILRWEADENAPSVEKLRAYLCALEAPDSLRLTILGGPEHGDSAVTTPTRRPAPIVHHRAVRRVRRGRAA